MNHEIFPCLCYDSKEKVQKSAQFYCEVFDGKLTFETPFMIDIEVFGQKLMLLNSGPRFEKNASISFMIICDTEEKVENYWKKLSEGGIILMELGEYPWSKKYGWVRDKLGVTWQVYLGEKNGDQTVVPTLMFIHENNGKALQAMKFYTSVFPYSKIDGVLKYGDGVGNENHEVPENVQHASFTIDDFILYG